MFEPVKGAWVYILECSDGSYYTGYTTDPERRFIEHNRGIGSRYTAARRPVVLRWTVHCRNRREAMSVERRVKGLTRQRKEELLNLNRISLGKMLAGWRRKEGASRRGAIRDRR